MRVPRMTASLSQSVLDYIAGYDFFISYAHADGLSYPQELARELKAIGYRVFLDQTGYAAGEDLRISTKRRLRMSASLILIARPFALQHSEWVVKELQLFTALGRAPIIIEFPGSPVPNVNSRLRRLLASRITIRETPAADVISPSSHIRDQVARSFTARRQETKRLRLLLAVLLLFLLIAMAAIWQSHRAVQARELAEQQRRVVTAQLLASEGAQAAALPQDGDGAARTGAMLVEAWRRRPSIEAYAGAIAIGRQIPWRSFRLHGRPDQLTWSPVRPLLAISDDAGAVLLISPTQARPVRRWHAKHRSVGLRFSGDGRWLSFAAPDEGFVIVDLATGRARRLILHGIISGVDYGRSGTAAAITTDAGDLYVVDIGRGGISFHEPRIGQSTTVSISADAAWAGWIDGKRGVRLLRFADRRSHLIPFSADANELLFSSDSRFAVIRDWDDRLRVITLATRQLRLLQGPGDIMALEVDPVRPRLAVGGDNSIVLFDLVTAAQTYRIDQDGAVADLEFSTDGRYLGVGSAGNAAHVLHADSGAVVMTSQTRGAVEDVAFDPAARVFGIASNDGSARVQRLEDPMTLARTTSLSPQKIIAISGDGHWAAAVTANGHVEILALWRPDLVADWVATDTIHAVATAEQASILAYGDAGGALFIADLSTGRRMVLRHPAAVADLAVDAPGRRVAAVFADGHVNLIDSRSGAERRLRNLAVELSFVTFSANGRFLAVAGEAPDVWLFDLAKSGPPRVIDTDDMVSALRFARSGDVLAIGTWKGAVIAYDAASGRRRLIASQKDMITSLAFSPDGRDLVSASQNGSVQLSRLATPRPSSMPVGKHGFRVNALAFRPDGKIFASASTDNSLQLYARDTGKLFWTFRTAEPLDGVAFSPGGDLLAVGGGDKMLRMFDARSHRLLAQFPMPTSIQKLAFAARGTRLVAASGERLIVWNASPGAVVDRLCSMKGRNLSRAEWDAIFLGAETWRPTCRAWRGGLPSG